MGDHTCLPNREVTRIVGDARHLALPLLQQYFGRGVFGKPGALTLQLPASGRPEEKNADTASLLVKDVPPQGHVYANLGAISEHPGALIGELLIP